MSEPDDKLPAVNKGGAPIGNKNAVGNNGGQPTKYRPKHCQQVVKLGKEGKSVAQMCSHFDIGRSTIDDWRENVVEFADAFARARVHSQAFHEDQGEKNIENRDFDTQMYIKKMQARFREDYTERQNMDLSGSVNVLFTKEDKGLL